MFLLGLNDDPVDVLAMSRLDKLVGVRVKRALCDNDSIYLETSGGWTKLEPSGECCAVCYIQHVSGADALANATIAKVEDIESASEPYDDGVRETWGHRITTDRGVCSLEMRVEHNGYYCGQLDILQIGEMPANAKPLEDR